MRIVLFASVLCATACAAFDGPQASDPTSVGSVTSSNGTVASASANLFDPSLPQKQTPTSDAGAPSMTPPEPRPLDLTMATAPAERAQADSNAGSAESARNRAINAK
jgi:hypothetical protein